MCEFPFSPRNDALFRAWRVWEHGDVLQQVTVRIVKEDGRGRHPGGDHRLVGWLPGKVGRRAADRKALGAATTAAKLARNAVCSAILCGPEPVPHSPSIALPAGPIQKNAACRAGTTCANRRPRTPR